MLQPGVRRHPGLYQEAEALQGITTPLPFTRASTGHFCSKPVVSRSILRSQGFGATIDPVQTPCSAKQLSPGCKQHPWERLEGNHGLTTPKPLKISLVAFIVLVSACQSTCIYFPNKTNPLWLRITVAARTKQASHFQGWKQLKTWGFRGNFSSCIFIFFLPLDFPLPRHKGTHEARARSSADRGALQCKHSAV